MFSRRTRIRLLLVAWLLLVGGAVAVGVAAEQNDLGPKAEQALESAGIDATVEVSGRDVTVTGSTADKERVETLVGAISGVRVVNFVDDSETDTEAGSFEVVVEAPHVVAVSVLSDRPELVNVKSDVPLRVFADPDHGRAIVPDETITANIDYPTDIDYFLLDLTAGETVSVRVDSMNFDADLVIDRAGNTGDVLASDNDSGGGVMGWDPAVTFTAEESATYLIGVFDQTGRPRLDPTGRYDVANGMLLIRELPLKAPLRTGPFGLLAPGVLVRRVRWQR